MDQAYLELSLGVRGVPARISSPLQYPLWGLNVLDAWLRQAGGGSGQMHV